MPQNYVNGPDGSLIDLDTLSPEDRTKLIAHLNKPKSLSDKIMEAMDSPAGFGETWSSRVKGAGSGMGLGAASGGLLGGLPTGGTGALPGAVAGGLAGGLGGFVFPPHTPGDYANQAIAGPLGAVGGTAVNMAKGPVAKLLAAMGSGYGSMQAQNAFGESVNRAVDPNGQKNDFVNSNPLAGLLSTLLPGLVQHYGQNTVNRNPRVASQNFANEQMPGSDIKLSNMDKLETMSPSTPGLQQAQAAGRTPPPAVAQIQAQIAQAEAAQAQNAARQAELGTQNAGLKVNTADEGSRAVRIKSEMNRLQEELKTRQAAMDQQIDNLKVSGATEDAPALIQARAEARQLKKEGTAAGIQRQAENAVTQAELQAQSTRAAQIQAAAEKRALSSNSVFDMQELSATDSPQLQLINKANALDDTKVKKADNTVSRSLNQEEALRLKQDSAKLDESLKDLRLRSDDAWAASSPQLRDIAEKSGNTTDLINNLKTTDVEGMKAYKAHLESQPNGAEHVAALKDAVISQFFHDAYDPNTKTLSRAAALFDTNGPFSREKMEVLLGKGKGAEFRAGIDHIQTLIKNQSAQGTAGTLAKRLVFYTLPNAIMWHRGGGFDQATAVGMGAAAGFDAILWPRIIDKMLSSKSFADEFYRISQGPITTETLKQAPRVAALLKSESKSVE